MNEFKKKLRNTTLSIEKGKNLGITILDEEKPKMMTFQLGEYDAHQLTQFLINEYSIDLDVEEFGSYDAMKIYEYIKRVGFASNNELEEHFEWMNINSFTEAITRLETKKYIHQNDMMRWTDSKK